MKMLRQAMLASASCAVVLTGMVLAETKVEVKKTHVCCPQCVKAVAKILDDSGAKGAADQSSKSVSFTATDDKAAQKTLDALAAGGFHGDTGNKDLKIKDDSGVKEGKVKSLTLTGTHNCCGQCTKILKETVAKVDGVESDDVKAKETKFTVKGDFDGAKVVKALNEAGFHVKADKDK